MDAPSSRTLQPYLLSEVPRISVAVFEKVFEGRRQAGLDAPLQGECLVESADPERKGSGLCSVERPQKERLLWRLACCCHTTSMLTASTAANVTLSRTTVTLLLSPPPCWSRDYHRHCPNALLLSPVLMLLFSA